MKFVYPVLIAIIIGCLLSFGGNAYIQYRYEIDKTISEETIEEIYGELLSEVVSLYEVEERFLKEKVDSLAVNLPLDIGILSLIQRDKGIEHHSYGTKYFYYKKEPYLHSYFYRNSSMRDVPRLIRGYVETDSGLKIDAVKYTLIHKLQSENLDIELTVDYKRLVELANAL